MPDLTPQQHDAIAYLDLPTTIRERCQVVLELARDDRLEHFAYHPNRLSDVVHYVVAVTRDTYPDGVIPLHSRWRHFNVGGIDRLAIMRQRLSSLGRDERARCQLELAITSVLLDAGAGSTWRYHEYETGREYARSEGLAVASFHMFLDGLFSSHAEVPWQADAAGLQGIDDARLAVAFQTASDNVLVGLEGRRALLQRLGDVVAHTPRYFGATQPRLGNLYDYLRTSSNNGVLTAGYILQVVLDSLRPIWPKRLSLGGVNLGDVGHHPQVMGEGLSAGLVPFHKLSQWLTYSLIEPLEAVGMQVGGLEALTGLAEYRNGGLLLDLGVLSPKHDEVMGQTHAPDAEVIVEWRALTTALLDEIAAHARIHLGLAASDLPLVKILEGGTWRAGRQVARARRPDGSAPLRVASDGTVF
ncbi:hypothetical protein NKDENANG_00654 [Candidatus Entotheonellaceae bacterium PAL068K]